MATRSSAPTCCFGKIAIDDWLFVPRGLFRFQGGQHLMGETAVIGLIVLQPDLVTAK